MNMSRLVTFAILLLILGASLLLFYRVVSGFILPLFLASLLAMMFRPLHLWFVSRFHGRQSLAAVVTTAVILVSVFTPLGAILTMAVRDGNRLVADQRGDLVSQLKGQMVQWGNRLGLQNPFRADFDSVFSHAADLDAVVQVESFDQTAELAATRYLDQLASDIDRLLQSLRQLNDFLEQLEQYDRSRRDYLDDPAIAPELGVRSPPQLADGTWGETELLGVDRLRAAGQIADWESQLESLRDRLFELAAELKDNASTDVPLPANEQRDELRQRSAIVRLTLANLKTDLQGGPLRSWLTDAVHPGEAQIKYLQNKGRDLLQAWLPSLTGQATAFVGGMLIGLIIMSISLYYFFIDGPTMVHSFMRLSPLDDEYERQLLAEFESISRAVVVATLLSAAAQGILAGIGFFFAGIGSVFLLTMLTMMLALVPFVGAAAVWVPVCLWLFGVEGRWLAALLLTLWGAGVVSMADNVIKPMVLHGHSKLHPLLALLSVLGGVTALGPIGILVGPMVVAILQSVLTMVNKELDHWQGETIRPPESAGSS